MNKFKIADNLVCYFFCKGENMNISIIGGDKRNQMLVKSFEKDKCFVYKCLLDMENENSLSECIFNSDVIVTAIPFSKDQKVLNTPLSDEKILIKNFIKQVHRKIIFCGNIMDKYKEKLEKNENTIIDLMKINDLALKNAIPTAEGIINLIINNTDSTIDASNILIIGFGRVGERTALVLKNLGANIFCMDNDKDKLANIASSSYNVIEKISLEQSYDVIVNTVPSLVLGEKELKCIDKNNLIIDVASNPGGVDYEYAKKNGYKVIHELGIPGKVAPETAAKYIKQIIINKLI